MHGMLPEITPMKLLVQKTNDGPEPSTRLSVVLPPSPVPGLKPDSTRGLVVDFNRLRQSFLDADAGPALAQWVSVGAAKLGDVRPPLRWGINE